MIFFPTRFILNNGADLILPMKQTARFGDGNALLFLDQQGVIWRGLHVLEKTSTTFYSGLGRTGKHTSIAHPLALF